MDSQSRDGPCSAFVVTISTMSPLLQAVVERHEAVVDLRADRPVADVGVDPVGEVERRRAGRQVLDVALRGEDEDLVLEDVELDALDELAWRPRPRAASP